MDTNRSGTLALCSLVFLALFIVARHTLSILRFGSPGGGGGDVRFAYFYYSASTVAVIVLLLNAANVGFHRSFTGYFLGLLWVNFHAAMNFFRLTYVWAGSKNEPE